MPNEKTCFFGLSKLNSCLIFFLFISRVCLNDSVIHAMQGEKLGNRLKNADTSPQVESTRANSSPSLDQIHSPETTTQMYPNSVDWIGKKLSTQFEDRDLGGGPESSSLVQLLQHPPYDHSFMADEINGKQLYSVSHPYFIGYGAFTIFTMILLLCKTSLKVWHFTRAIKHFCRSLKRACAVFHFCKVY